MRDWIRRFGAILAALALVLPGEARAENEDRSNDARYAENCAINYMQNVALEPEYMGQIMSLVHRFDLDLLQVQRRAATGDYSVFMSGTELADCDRAFGFSQDTPQIDSTPAMPAVSDFDCAVAYRLLAAIRHDIDQNQVQAQNAMERAEYALRRHQTANPDLDPSVLGPQVNGLARTRGEQIQQGQESGEALTNGINACEAQYGFATAGGQ